MQESTQPSRVTRPGESGATPPSELAGKASGTLQFPPVAKGQPPTLREQGGEALALAGITHDARNLVTALGLCAELLNQPGVLGPRHSHFGAEIQLIARSSTQLVRRLSELCRKTAQAKEDQVPEAPVADVSESVQKMHSLLSAIAGPVAEVQFACLPCGGHVRLTEENLSRILVNLVRNAADAMPTGGRIRITTQRGGGASFLWTLDGEDMEQSAEYLWDDSPHEAGHGTGTVVVTVEDNGPGIPTEFLERVFDSGFTTRAGGRSWPESQHHGLGLSIVRELVEKAGGTVRAGNSPLHGARFEIELPLTNVMPNLLSEPNLNGGSEAQ